MKNTTLAEMADDSDDVSKLSRQMQGRYAVQYPLFKQRTMSLFKNLTMRGEYSYIGVEPKITAINKLTGKDKDYIRTIMSSCPIGVTQSITNVMNAICSARIKYGLEPFRGNIQKQCVAEMNKVFIVKKVLLPGTDGKNHSAYIPKFAFLAE